MAAAVPLPRGSLGKGWRGGLRGPRSPSRDAHPRGARGAAAAVVAASHWRTGLEFSVSGCPYLAARAGSDLVPARGRCGSGPPRVFCLQSHGHETRPGLEPLGDERRQ